MKAAVKKRNLVLLSLTIFMIDQAVKICIRGIPLYAVSFSAAPLFEITHCENTGAAFSILSGRTGLLSALSLVLLLVLIGGLWRVFGKDRLSLGMAACLIGGGAGNLTDRLLRGSVTDYIRLLFIDFPVFNFADICITISVTVLSFNLISGRLDEHPEESTHGTDY